MGMGMATDTAPSCLGALMSALATFAALQAPMASAQSLPADQSQSASPAAASTAAPSEVGAAGERPQSGAEEPLARTRVGLRRWQIVPRILWSETYSDNVARSAAPVAESGWITLLAPGIHVDGAGPRVQGYLDYRHDEYVYSRHSELSNGQNWLDSSATVEGLENWLFLDARARIVQVNTSPFGSSTTETPGFNPNRTETSAVQLSPYVRGLLAGQTLYQLRFAATASHASGDAVPDTTTREWLGRIQNVPGGQPFGWSVDGRQLVIRNATINEQQDSRIRGSLMYAPYWSMRVAAYGGVEVTDMTGTRERTSTPGVGVEWSPSGRTQLAATVEQRFFGTGHSILFSHRTPRMALTYSDGKDVSTFPGRLGIGGQSSVYNLMADLLAASVPDPIKRADAVRARLDQTGAVQFAPASAGFLTTRPTLLDRRELSVAALGRMNTVTFIGNRNEYRTLSPDSGSVDVAIGASAIREQGFSASWAHQLSPRTSITLADTHWQSKDVASERGSHQHTLYVTLLMTVGRRTWFSLGGRRIKFDSDFSPGYLENAAVLTAAMHF